MSAHDRERLSAYLDGELDTAARSVVEAHLAACAECRGVVAELRAVDEAARRIPADAAPGYFDSFPTRLRRRLEADPQRRKQRRRVPVWTWALAAALLLAVVTPLTLRQAPEPTATPEAPPEPAQADAGASPIEAEPQATPAPAPPSLPPAGRLGPPARARERARPAEPRPPAAPPPSEPAEPRAVEMASAPEPADVSADQAAASLEARAEPAPAPGEAKKAPRPSEVRYRAERESALASAPEPARKDPYAALADERPRDVEGWRRLREAWRGLAARQGEGPLADEARVRTIEAGLAAFQAGGDPDDLALLHRDGEEYLARAEAPQKDRVRRALEEVAASPSPSPRP